MPLPVVMSSFPLPVVIVKFSVLSKSTALSGQIRDVTGVAGSEVAAGDAAGHGLVTAE